ncbi:MAG: hypothetical protein R2762_18815 [Bryobacteraceae bacterium]
MRRFVWPLCWQFGAIPSGRQQKVNAPAGARRSFAATTAVEGNVQSRQSPCEDDPSCGERAVLAEQSVIGYITSDTIRAIRDKRILWLDDPELIKPEADVFRKLLIRIDSVRDPAAAYSMVIANLTNARPLLASGATKPALVIYQPGQPYSGQLSDEAKKEAREQGAAGLTDCPLELYTIAVGRLLASK